jgi:hypothetical protein
MSDLRTARAILTWSLVGAVIWTIAGYLLFG